MKLGRFFVSMALCFSMAACQAPMITALKSSDASAVKRELAAGTDPGDCAPASNWWWKAPMLPVAFVGELAELCLAGTVVGLLVLVPLYGKSNSNRIGEFALIEGVIEYGDHNAYSYMWEHASEVADTNPEGAAAILRYALESGKIKPQYVKDSAWRIFAAYDSKQVERTDSEKWKIGAELYWIWADALAKELGTNDETKRLVEFTKNRMSTPSDYITEAELRRITTSAEFKRMAIYELLRSK